MKPKVSSGYLTPQANKMKKPPKPTRAESDENLSMPKQLNDKLFETLMSCPLKRQMVLNLLSSEKDNLNEYKQKRAQDQKRKDLISSPLSKIQKKYQCESPTALLRRRALEQQNRSSPVSENQSEASSGLSHASSGSSTTIPFNKLLDGITAYVEIKNKNKDHDRSHGIKVLMRAMGATIRDRFTKDVTHVVFKDGSYDTYQKAKLLKTHLVSVLWIEAVKTSGYRVPEKKFPAIGTEDYDHNVSTICSQMQKDYEEIIRDELRRSLSTGTPLPSTKSLIHRRRTIMTPIHSTSSFTFDKFSQESSQDREVASINFGSKQCEQTVNTTSVFLNKSPELTSDDDSDLGAIINGTIVKRKKDIIIPDSMENSIIISNPIENLGSHVLSDATATEKSQSLLTNFVTPKKINKDNRKSVLCDSNMDMTCLIGSSNITDSINASVEKENKLDSSNESIYNKKTPKIKYKGYCDISFDKSKSGDLFNSPDENVSKRRTRLLPSKINISSDKSTNISEENLLKSNLNPGHMSSLHLPHSTNGLEILSKNACISEINIIGLEKDDHTTSSMSALQLSSEKDNKVAEKTSSTNMSSLHISSDSNKGCPGKDHLQKPLSTESNNNIPDPHMLKQKSVLKAPMASNQLGHSLNSSSNKSFSPLNSNVINQVMEILHTPLKDEHVTRRRQIAVVANEDRTTYNTRRKTLLSTENNMIDSEAENATRKIAKNDRKSEEHVPEYSSPTKKFKKNIGSDEADLMGKKVSKEQKLDPSPLKGLKKNLFISLVLEEESKKQNTNLLPEKSMPLKKRIVIPDDASPRTKSRKSTIATKDVLNNDSDSVVSNKAVSIETKRTKGGPPQHLSPLSNKKQKKIRVKDSSPFKPEQLSSSQVDSQQQSSGNNMLSKTSNKGSGGPKITNLIDSDDDDGKQPNNSKSRLRKSGPVKKIARANEFNEKQSNDDKTPKKKIGINKASTETNRDKKAKRSGIKDVLSTTLPKENEVNPKATLNNIQTRSRRKTLNERLLLTRNKDVESTDAENDMSKNSSDDAQGSDSCSKKNRRKLYNPDDSIEDIIVNDDKERQEKRTEVKKRKSDEGVFLKPNIVSVSSNILLTKRAKAFIDHNNIDVLAALNKDSEESECETGKKISGRRGKKGKSTKRISVNSDADEQQELAKEFVNKKENSQSKRDPKKLDARSEGRIIKKRQSVRLSQRPRKPLSFGNSSSSSDEKSTPINRRSTMEFQSKSQSSAKRKLKIDKIKRPSIVCTKMHKDDIHIFSQIVKKLGGFVIEDEVSSKTTHLVAGEPKRTINMLRAITMGCWVLKHEWLLNSLEAGKWLPEEDYELTEFSPAVQQCRLQRQAFGPSFSMDIFQDCGTIYIARGSIPRCSDLRELVSYCKGKVITIARNADIVVGEYVRQQGVTCVKETWILDSITRNKKMSLKKYMIPPNASDTSAFV